MSCKDRYQQHTESESFTTGNTCRVFLLHPTHQPSVMWGPQLELEEQNLGLDFEIIRRENWSVMTSPFYDSVEQYVEFCSGSHVIKKVLIANNGIGAIKAIRSIRRWSFETFGNERQVRNAPQHIDLQLLMFCLHVCVIIVRSFTSSPPHFLFSYPICVFLFSL